MKTLKLLLLISLILNLCFIGFLGYKQIQKLTSDDSEQLSFTAPRIDNDGVSYSILNFVPLRNAVEEYLATLNTNFSFYFEYLPTGTSVQANAKEQLPTASLVKVPIAMDAVKMQELGVFDFNQKLQITDDNLDILYNDIREIEPDLEVTLGEAIEYMLTISDNTSLRLIENLLLENIDALDYTVVDVTDLDYDKAEVNLDLGLTNSIIVSPKDYSSIFKCLYFSCYLSEEGSSYLLELMSNSDYDERIVAGIEGDYKVAHKIGVLSEQSQSDCGIVYYPGKPYLLCIMIATDRDNADFHIANLSKIVFDYIDNYDELFTD